MVLETAANGDRHVRRAGCGTAEPPARNQHEPVRRHGRGGEGRRARNGDFLRRPPRAPISRHSTRSFAGAVERPPAKVTRCRSRRKSLDGHLPRVTDSTRYTHGSEREFIATAMQVTVIGTGYVGTV